MLNVLEQLNAPEWVLRLSICLKYVLWTCAIWFALSFLRDKGQMNDWPYEYGAVALTVWLVVALVVDRRNAREHELMRIKIIQIFLPGKITPISAPPRSRE